MEVPQVENALPIVENIVPIVESIIPLVENTIPELENPIEARIPVTLNARIAEMEDLFFGYFKTLSDEDRKAVLEEFSQKSKPYIANITKPKSKKVENVKENENVNEEKVDDVAVEESLKGEIISSQVFDDIEKIVEKKRESYNLAKQNEKEDDIEKIHSVAEDIKKKKLANLVKEKSIFKEKTPAKTLRKQFNDKKAVDSEKQKRFIKLPVVTNIVSSTINSNNNIVINTTNMDDKKEKEVKNKRKNSTDIPKYTAPKRNFRFNK